MSAFTELEVNILQGQKLTFTGLEVNIYRFIESEVYSYRIRSPLLQGLRSQHFQGPNSTYTGQKSAFTGTEMPFAGSEVNIT